MEADRAKFPIIRKLIKCQYLVVQNHNVILRLQLRTIKKRLAAEKNVTKMGRPNVLAICGHMLIKILISINEE